MRERGYYWVIVSEGFSPEIGYWCPEFGRWRISDEVEDSYERVFFIHEERIIEPIL